MKNIILILANIVCLESGWDRQDGELVLQTIINRARQRGTTLEEEALRAGQYAVGTCKVLKDHHIQLARSAVYGTLKGNEPWRARITHFAAKRVLSRKHRLCKQSTIKEVWEHAGYTELHRSKSGHVYFGKSRSNKGNGEPCPIKKNGGS